MPKIIKSDLVTVDNNNLIVKIPDLAESKEHVVFMQSDGEPLTDAKPYFEVKITKQAKDAILALGISQETDLDAEDVEDDEQEEKGWDKKPDAIAYFSDDGSISSPSKHIGKEYVQTYSQGDTIGFLLDYNLKNKSLICIFKNNALICRRWVTLVEDRLLPTINGWWGPAELEVAWISDPKFALSHAKLENWHVPSTITVTNNVLVLRSSQSAAVVQAPCCLSKAFQYFEVKIISMGENGGFGPIVGVTSTTLSEKDIPGNSFESVGFRATDGCLYHDKKVKGGKSTDHSQACGEGDIVGCGILFVEEANDLRSKQKVIIYFTKNGSIVRHSAFDQPPGGFYPSVALDSTDCSVEVNSGCSTPTIEEADEWCKKATTSFGLGGLADLLGELPESGPKHELGETEGDFRFSDQICLPENGIIRSKATIKKEGKLLQYLKPFSEREPLFTAEVIDGATNEKSVVCIGITGRDQSVGCLPGGLVDTVGYQSSGHILSGNKAVPAPSYTQGDVVSCFIENLDTNCNHVKFHKNGSFVGMAQLQGHANDLFPSIGFQREPSSLKVSWQSLQLPFPAPLSKNNLSSWLCNSQLKLVENHLSVPRKLRKQWAMYCTSPQPLSLEWRYFEVKILCKQLSTKEMYIPKAPVIGVTNDLAQQKFKKLSKKRCRCAYYFCNANSVGFIDATEINTKDNLKPIKEGDRLGFGVFYPDEVKEATAKKRQIVGVYCCVNGEIVWKSPMEQPHGGFFPVVSLYKFGDAVEIHHDAVLPSLPLWWTQEVKSVRELMKKAQRDAEGETVAQRKKKPAYPATRPANDFNKYKVYIHCDKERYNESTYLQKNLEEKGFVTSLPSSETMNMTTPPSDLKTYHVVLVCLGPESKKSERTTNILKMVKSHNLPVIPVIIETLTWPLEGPSQLEFARLTYARIELSSDFFWGCDQAAELVQKLKGHGYNAKDISVKEAEGVAKLYSDAQKGNKTTNEKSDPNALRKAIIDADKYKVSGDNRPASCAETSDRQKEVTFDTRPRSVGGNKQQVHRNSKTCIIL